MPPAVLDRAFFRNLFRQTEADEFLIEHPKTGILMVLVPAGRFLTDTGDDAPFEADLPAYYVAVHPVTNAQYARFVDETEHSPPDNQVWQESGKMNHPVTNVDWEDAMAFCRWAGLRLPTELEWEKAARGLDGRAYPWGKNWNPYRCRNDMNKGRATTAGVWRYGHGGAPFGGLQLSGNVWEWCDDWYDNAAYALYRQGNLAVPSSGEYRVVRGGSWASGRDLVRMVGVMGDPWASDYQQKVRRQRQQEMQRMQEEIRRFLAGHRDRRQPGDRDNRCGFRCGWVLGDTP